MPYFAQKGLYFERERKKGSGVPPWFLNALKTPYFKPSLSRALAILRTSSRNASQPSIFIHYFAFRKGGFLKNVRNAPI